MDTSNQITFIIPNRGGEHIDFVIKQIDGLYPESKYIVITQDDDKPFMRGQLFNIAHNFVDTEYMCYLDNDMFFPEFVDLIEKYKELGCIALQPFTNIRQVEINDDGEIVEISEAKKSPYGKGGVTFISKDNFEKVGGMSNLYIGYGCEDTDFNYRCGGIADLPTAICHIQHPKRREHVGINMKIAQGREGRDIQSDTFRNTVYDVLSMSTEGTVTYINVNNITVDNDFIYKDILELH